MSKMKKILAIGLCISLFHFTNTAIAENVNQPNIPIPMVTLLVKKYGDLEKSLQIAILQSDFKQINAYLSPDFEERNGDNPNSPVPKEIWIQSEIKKENKEKHFIQQMAVRELDNIFIVSFLSVSRSTLNKDAFIVDVWKRIGIRSELMARYSTSLKQQGTESLK